MKKAEKSILIGLIVSLLFSAFAACYDRRDTGSAVGVTDKIVENTCGYRWWGVVFPYPSACGRNTKKEKKQLRFRLLEFCRTETNTKIN